MKKIKKLRKNESGQSALEFAMMLPFFVLIILAILDFGWYFYNIIMVENSARNAARFACVNYEKIAYDRVDNTSRNGNNSSGQTADYDPSTNTVTLSDGDEISNDGTAAGMTDEEENMLSAVKDTLPSGVKDVKVKVIFSYDGSSDASRNGFDVNKRPTGDVKVSVSCKYRAITFILGTTGDHMYRKIGAHSTYKVERPVSTTQWEPITGS